MTTPQLIRPFALSIGGFFAMSLDTLVVFFRPPFQWREYVQQSWFLASVSLGPTVFVGIPFTVLVIFQFNQVLIEVGALDLSGAGAAVATVAQIGPIVTTFVVAGAGATAMCADLGARKIREELDAMEVLGVDPIRRLVVPRVAGSITVAFLLNSVVILIGLGGAFLFSVIFQGATAGQYVESLSLLVGVPELVHSQIKAVVFGLAAALVACYRGLYVSGGPKGVGNAVNETVVYSFLLLFVINVQITALPYALGLL